MPDESPRSVIFGEVLFDQFPDGKPVLGGAPFNVAWHLQAFGQSPLFISRVGEDELGRRIREAMLDWGMDTTGLQSDSTHPTGTVAVNLRDGEPSFEIVADRAYDFIDAAEFPAMPSQGLLYHGSLALRHAVSRGAWESLRTHFRSRVFVDVNLRPPWYDDELLLRLLHGTRWLKLNEEELLILVSGGEDLIECAEQLQEQTGIELLILTRGSQGAVARDGKGELSRVAPAVEAAGVVDTVGAGDAFAGICLLGRLLAWPLDETLVRAQEFASAIVSVRGATVSDRSFYADFCKRWGLE